MQVIYKYPFALDQEVTILMPIDPLILHFGNQRGVLTIWAQVNTEAVMFPKRFVVLGTGHTIPSNTMNLRYIGSAQFHDGMLVWHLYEVLE